MYRNGLTLGRKLDAVSLALLLLILLLLGTGLMSHWPAGPVLAAGTLPGGWAVHLRDRAVSALFALVYLRLGLGLFIGGFGWTWFGWALLLVVGVSYVTIGYFVYFLLVLPLLSVLDLVWSRAGRTAAMASSEPR